METIIMEIETFGLAERFVIEDKNCEKENFRIVDDAIRKELSQSQLDELIVLIKKPDVSHTEIVDKFKRFGYEVAPKIIASIVLESDFKKLFIQ